MSELRFGDKGLTWDGISEELTCTETPDPSLSISEMVAQDAAIQANLLSGGDHRILQRLLSDLADNEHIAHCARSFKQLIDRFNDSPTKSHVIEALETGLPMVKAFNSMTDYGKENRRGDDAFTAQIIKPCCLLLGIDFPGSPAQGQREIVQVDFEVGMAVGDIMLRFMQQPKNTEGIRVAVTRLVYADKFLYAWRFLLFKDRLKGVVFDERRRKAWAEAFGEPFDDGK